MTIVAVHKYKETCHQNNQYCLPMAWVKFVC